ncbi:MAG: hypothetical protein RLZ34_1718 [Pseudomonadota bacterium]
MIPSLGRRRLLAAAALAPVLAGASQTRVVRVAAASDLQFVLPEVVQRYAQHAGVQVAVTYAASGQLAMQILHGAPFDMFLSADEAFVQRLVQAGLTQDEGVLYAHGRLALVAAAQTEWPLDARGAGLSLRLKQGQLRRFAVANPRIAPYGMRAQEALQSLGLWQPLQKHLVFGENVAQAMQFALSDQADGGVVALSLAMAPTLQGKVRHVTLPEHLHQPLRQRMVRLRRAPAVAADLYAYLQRPDVQQAWQAHGFGAVAQAR